MKSHRQLLVVVLLNTAFCFLKIEVTLDQQSCKIEHKQNLSRSEREKKSTKAKQKGKIKCYLPLTKCTLEVKTAKELKWGHSKGKGGSNQ